MNKIVCPKCKNVFQIDESGYADIIKQVRDQEFNEEIGRRENELEEKTEMAVKLAREQMQSRLRDDLADKDAAKAHRAMRSLIAAPADALAYLRPRLKPAEGVEAKRIERWVADLDAEEFAVREKAAEELRKLGELAEPASRKALDSRPTLEMSRRLRALLDEVSQQQWHPAPEILRQVRAIEVLERSGTPEARELLESLSRGAAGAHLTREARAAVHRYSSGGTH